MPFFIKKNNKILFIHIPKTGGSSVELYFSNKFNIKLDNNILYGTLLNKKVVNLEHTMQHMSYSTIYKHRNYFNIDPTRFKIITIVRNPYNRIMSELFYIRRIHIESSKEETFEQIKKFILEEPIKNDYHNIPQYKFITDKNKMLISNIIILRTETLNKDMQNLGYADFNVVSNANQLKINYNDYLNDASINLINEFYKDDFLMFNYPLL
jgi:hypothetical protein